MDVDAPMQDIVLFEVPTRVAAERLLQHVTESRLAWLDIGDEPCIVGVFLQPDHADLALLLRSVQTWIAESELAAIRFEIDGRTYVLETRQPLLAGS
jgi:hypothetical protein